MSSSEEVLEDSLQSSRRFQDNGTKEAAEDSGSLQAISDLEMELAEVEDQLRLTKDKS